MLLNNEKLKFRCAIFNVTKDKTNYSKITELCVEKYEAPIKTIKELKQWINGAWPWFEGSIIKRDVISFPSTFGDLMKTQSELFQVIFVYINKVF